MMVDQGERAHNKDLRNPRGQQLTSLERESWLPATDWQSFGPYLEVVPPAAAAGSLLRPLDVLI